MESSVFLGWHTHHTIIIIIIGKDELLLKKRYVRYLTQLIVAIYLSKQTQHFLLSYQ